MSSPAPPPRARGIDYSLPTCGDARCGGRGRCVFPAWGGGEAVCECELGYTGDACQDTVNGSLSLPLTLSVLAVIAGLIVIAFIVAKMRQKQKKKKKVEEEDRRMEEENPSV